MSNRITIVLKYAFAMAIIFIAASCINYPPVKRELFSWSLSREQLTEIKNVLEENGYKKLSSDDYSYEGAFVTQYAKEINTSTKTKNNLIQIMMSFKTDDLSSGKYRNYGFSVFNLYHNDIEEIDAEINRIENIIYSKLVEFAGAKNIVRGPR